MARDDNVWWDKPQVLLGMVVKANREAPRQQSFKPSSWPTPAALPLLEALQDETLSNHELAELLREIAGELDRCE